MDATAPGPRSSIERLIGELSVEVDALAGKLTDRVVAAEPPYLEDSPDSRRYLYDSCHANISAILAHLDGTRPLRPESARATGRLRAEQGVPLATVLRCYRFGVQLIWEESAARATGIGREDLVAFTAETWSVIDMMSDAIATGYHETELEMLRADAEAHAHLLRELFEARPESPARTLETLRALQLPDTGTYVVVAVEIPSAPTETATAADTTAAVARQLRNHGLSCAWDTMTDTRLGLICAGPGTDLTAPLTESTALFPARVGISRPFTQPPAIAAAVPQARVALRCRPPGTRATTWYGTQPIPALVVQSPDAARRAASEILGPVGDLTEPLRTELLTTLQTWFDCDGSTTAAAKHLHCHRNTILNRLHRLRDLTGRDCDIPAQAAELYLALQSDRLLGAIP